MLDASLAQEFDLDVSATVSEEELLHALETRIDVLLRTDPLRFVQTLYRMDVDERAAEVALEDANAPAALAHLILQRTRLKAATRAAFRPPAASEEDADLLL